MLALEQILFCRVFNMLNDNILTVNLEIRVSTDFPDFKSGYQEPDTAQSGQRGVFGCPGQQTD